MRELAALLSRLRRRLRRRARSSWEPPGLWSYHDGPRRDGDDPRRPAWYERAARPARLPPALFDTQPRLANPRDLIERMRAIAKGRD